jgi:hypothetical protein
MPQNITTPAVNFESDPNRPAGLYCYNSDPVFRRSWRPELVPVILEWLAGVPAEDLQYLIGIAVGVRGGMIAHFAKIPRAGGPARRVTFRIYTTTSSSVENDYRIWSHPSELVPYESYVLDAVCNVP